MALCDLLEAEAFSQEPPAQPSGSAQRAPKKQNEKRPRRTISAATRVRRHELVTNYKRTEDRLTDADLSRRCNIDTSALQGMIREDTSRYSEATLKKFLKVINVPRREWDRKR